MACPETRIGPGWEAQFATNHLGHFALVNRLWPLLAAGGGARGLGVLGRASPLAASAGTTSCSSTATTSGRPTARPNRPTPCSPCSWTRSAQPAGVRAFAVHPGGIMTPLQRHLATEEMVEMGWIDEDGTPLNPNFKTPEQGAATADLVRDLPAAGRHGRGVLRGLRHRRARRRRATAGVRRHAIDPDACRAPVDAVRRAHRRRCICHELKDRAEMTRREVCPFLLLSPPTAPIASSPAATSTASSARRC